MELLSELIYILKRSETSSLDAILPGSKARKLFNVISKGKAATNGEAAEIIYGAPGQDENYLALKAELVKLLTELVFDANTFEGEDLDYQEFSFRAKKNLMIAEKLLQRNVYHNAEEIILKIKSEAEKFQGLELQVDCAKHLRTIYTLKGHPKEVSFYNVVLKKLAKFFQYEQDAIGCLDLLESKVKYFIGRYREIAIEAKQYSAQLMELQKESASPALKLYRYRIDLIKCYHVDDTRDWHFILERMTDMAQKFPVLRTASLLLYLDLEWAKYMRATANIPEATNYVNKALQQCSYEAFNKFEVQALNFDLQIKEKKYTEAGEILLEVRGCSQFLLIEAPGQAAWILKEAYLYFIFSATANKTALEKYTSSFASGFSASGLTAACKSIHEDKKGYNFMLVVIREALMKLKHPQETKTGGTELQDYYQAHMKDSCEERSKNFIKKFAKLSKSGFATETNKKETGTEEVKAVAKSFDTPELIPYDDLLDLIIKNAAGKVEKK